MEVSSRQYDTIRKLPYVGVAPTYPWGNWRASKDQLTLFFAKAKELGHEGFMVWDLPQATEDQLDAIKEFPWDTTPTPEKTEIEVRYKTDEASIKLTGV